MSLIQYFIIAVVLFMWWRLYQRKVVGELTTRGFVEWLLLWLVVGIIVILPNSTTYVANIVGVGRGSDLVIYLALLLGFYLLFRIFVRLEKIDRDITTLVRNQAMRGHEHDSGE